MSLRALSRTLMPVWVSVALAALVFAAAVSLYPRPPLLNDAYNYSLSAQRLAYHGVYSFSTAPPADYLVPNAFVTPGYMLFLSGFYSTFGERSIEGTAAAKAAQPVVQGAQFLLALGIVGLISSAGLLLGGSRMAYLAGALAAVYLPFAWSASVGLSECLGAFLAALQLLMALRLTRRSQTSSWLEFGGFGLASAALALVRPALVFWTVVPLLYIAVRRFESFRKLAKLTGVALACFLLLMAPWWVRNAVVLGRFIPLSTGAGDPMLVSSGGVVLTAEEQAVADRARSAGRDPQSAAAIFRLRRQIAEDPARFARDRLTRVVQALRAPWIAPRDVMWEEVFNPDIPSVDFEGAFPTEPSIGVAASWRLADYLHKCLLVASTLGLLFVRRSPRLLLLASVPVYVIAVHFFTLFIDRYFFPAMPSVILMAAAGLYGSWHVLSEHLRRSPVSRGAST